MEVKIKDQSSLVLIEQIGAMLDPIIGKVFKCVDDDNYYYITYTHVYGYMITAISHGVTEICEINSFREMIQNEGFIEVIEPIDWNKIHNQK